jgi:polygalacturonase
VTEGPNNDGIDPDSCRNVLIEHCVFDTGDDCVVLKSGYNEDGWRVARPTENVVMRWCSSRRGHGGLVIGSEMSGDVRNVYLHDCTFDGTDHALRIKSRRDRGGVVENVWAENLTARNMKYDVVIMTMDYGADRNRVAGERPPVFRNIHVRDVNGDGAPVAIQLQGLAESPITNVSFCNVSIRAAQGVIASDVRGISFRNVHLTPQAGAAFHLTDAAQVLFDECRTSAGTEVFLQLAGQASRETHLQNSKLSGADTGKGIVREPEVRDDAVIVH